MTDHSLKDQFSKGLLMFYDETFEKVGGIYLDRNTSLFETLKTITAEEASRPVSARCASLAAHVEHVRFYIETSMKYLNGENQEYRADWGDIWARVEKVTPEEWADSQRRLEETYRQAREIVTSSALWSHDDNFGIMLAIMVHTAHHLGEIRQALCTLKAPA